jgi:hypothetical protein
MLTHVDASEAGGSPRWVAHVRHDDGRETAQTWDSPTLARIMAAAQSSSVHFVNARCRVDHEAISSVLPRTPFPVA